MINLTDIKQVYLIGIGGIGMSGLARYFYKKGFLVSGYDKTSTPLTQALEAEGIDVFYKDDVSLIPSQFQNKDAETLIIYT
ncbi:MAG TPA: Mur ligase domain-containing protein, partial [Pelobium sp.]|nr:Mur ligase domain-containing protein [Pelobium sp.]